MTGQEPVFLTSYDLGYHPGTRLLTTRFDGFSWFSFSFPKKDDNLKRIPDFQTWLGLICTISGNKGAWFTFLLSNPTFSSTTAHTFFSWRDRLKEMISSYLLSLSNSQLCLPPGFTNLYIYICNYVNIWDSTSSWWLINLSNFSIKMINLIHFGDWLYIYLSPKLVSFPH